MITGLTLKNSKVQVPIPFPGAGIMINIDRQKVFEFLLSLAQKEENIKVSFNTPIQRVNFDEASFDLDGKT